MTLFAADFGDKEADCLVPACVHAFEHRIGRRPSRGESEADEAIQSGYGSSSSGEERGRADGPHLPERPGGRQGNDSGAAAAVSSAIAENTSVSNFRQLSFSPKAKYPTLGSLQPLAEKSGAGLSRLDPSQRRDLLEDRSARTEVEKADGAWPAVERAGGGRLTLADLRQIFSDQARRSILSRTYGVRSKIVTG